MRRFFINPNKISNTCGVITDHEARHIGMVLRMQPGNRIELFDGQGTVYQAQITAINRSTVETTILSSHRHQAYPPFLSIAQALIKGNKMDLIIQKATELGVSNLWPTTNQHSSIGSVSPHQVDRWQRIAHEACKQCDRPTPLIVHRPLPLPQVLARSANIPTKILLWENEETRTLRDIDLKSPDHVLLLIGPEGGFSKEEVESAISSGFQPVSIGPRILRAETAAIATITLVQFLLGNLNPKSTD